MAKQHTGDGDYATEDMEKAQHKIEAQLVESLDVDAKAVTRIFNALDHWGMINWAAAIDISQEFLSGKRAARRRK